MFIFAGAIGANHDMKKLKILLFVVSLALVATVLYLKSQKKQAIPDGTEGIEAEMIALQVKRTINNIAWDSTKYLSWSLNEAHFLWDKNNAFAEVQWKGNKVLLDLKEENAVAYLNNVIVTKPNSQKQLIQTAKQAFEKASFWLRAPTMIYSDSTIAAVVPIDQNHNGLLISQTTKTTSEAEQYLWKIDKNGRPVSLKTWHNDFLKTGEEISWEDWIQLNSGAWIALKHTSKSGDIVLKNLQDSHHILSFRKTDPFTPLERKKKDYTD